MSWTFLVSFKLYPEKVHFLLKYCGNKYFENVSKTRALVQLWSSRQRLPMGLRTVTNHTQTSSIYVLHCLKVFFSFFYFLKQYFLKFSPTWKTEEKEIEGDLPIADSLPPNVPPPTVRACLNWTQEISSWSPTHVAGIQTHMPLSASFKDLKGVSNLHSGILWELPNRSLSQLHYNS